MFETVPGPVFWGLAAVQLTGLASIFFTRGRQGSAGEAIGQLFFFACLTLVGLATMAALVVDHGACLMCGTTLSVMVLGATIDFGGQRRTMP